MRDLLDTYCLKTSINKYELGLFKLYYSDTGCVDLFYSHEFIKTFTPKEEDKLGMFIDSMR